MPEFYRRLKAGQPKDEVLQEAMQKLRQNPAWRHPYFLAAFQLSGIRKPIS
jgi:CHAT domain-containing protein